jgi:HPt (histidine-containing phosphotransfer) domain-containing protein
MSEVSGNPSLLESPANTLNSSTKLPNTALRSPIPDEIIAPAHLEELLSMADILPTLLATFCRDVPQSIEGIRSAVELEDALALARAAHSVSGAAGSMGGMRLVSICREIETRARAGSVEGVGDMLPLIDAEYSELCVALERISQDEKSV